VADKRGNLCGVKAAFWKNFWFPNKTQRFGFFASFYLSVFSGGVFPKAQDNCFIKEWKAIRTSLGCWTNTSICLPPDFLLFERNKPLYVEDTVQFWIFATDTFLIIWHVYYMIFNKNFSYNFVLNMFVLYFRYFLVDQGSLDFLTATQETMGRN
jgi:hypothetical protein